MTEKQMQTNIKRLEYTLSLEHFSEEYIVICTRLLKKYRELLNKDIEIVSLRRKILDLSFNIESKGKM